MDAQLMQRDPVVPSSPPMQSTSNPPPTSSPPSTAPKNNMLIQLLFILGFVLLLVSLGVAAYLFLKKEKPVPHTSISGTIHFNALKPDAIPLQTYARL